MAGKVRRLFAIAIALTLVGGCARETHAPPRLVLLYAPCTLSTTFLSPYDPEIPFTPNLNAFAREGVTFRRHQTESPSSGIAYASIFSGAQADRHGAYRHPTKLKPDLKLISEIYAEAGYDTFFWNGHSMTAKGLNYDQGVPKRNRVPWGLRPNHPRFEKLLLRLQKDPDYRALVITNLTLTHARYKNKFLQEFLNRHPDQAHGLSTDELEHFVGLYHENEFSLAWNHEETVEQLGLPKTELATLKQVIELLYKSNVSELDRIFGSIVDAIRKSGLLDESLIVFTADHGEVHDRPSALFKWTHSMQLAPEVLSVPWIIRSSDESLLRGRYEGVTRSIDVLPTLLGLSGIAIPEASQIEGTDLSSALRGIDEAPSLEAYSHTTVLVHRVFQQMYDPATARDWNVAKRFFPDESPRHMWVALRREDELYKRRKLDGETWETEVFDLATDPWASAGSFDLEDPVRRAAASRLKAYQERLVRSYEDDRAAEQKRRLPDDEEALKLKGLGYIQ